MLVSCRLGATPVECEGVVGVAAPGHLTESVRAVWVEVVSAYGDGAEAIEGPALEAYCGQVATLRICQEKLASEGLIVADPKGVPIEHPAIRLERAAQDEIRKWGDQFRPPRRRR